MKRSNLRILVALVAMLMCASAARAVEPSKCWNATDGALEQTCNTSGQLEISIATGTIAVVNTIASGTVQLMPVAEFDYATASVSAASTGTFTLAATSSSVIIVNESSTQPIRFCVGCTLNATCTLATGPGIALVAGASFGMDGVSINAVEYCNPAGAAADVSIQSGRKPD